MMALDILGQPKVRCIQMTSVRVNYIDLGTCHPVLDLKRAFAHSHILKLELLIQKDLIQIYNG